jgi:hypothetical protein
MATAPYKLPSDAQAGSASGAAEERVLLARYVASPAATDTDVILAAVTDDGSEQTVSSMDAQPDVPRTITATAGGTAGDIKAIQVTINGTNVAGNDITEDLPAFTVNTAGTVEGSKVFASVTSVVIPAHDGTGATTSIGTGSKLGLCTLNARNPVVPGMTSLNGTREGTEPTVAVSSSAVESNTVTLDSTLDGNVVEFVYIVPPGS